MKQHQTSLSLKYLLWKQKVDREHWIEQLASWANCSPDTARVILDRGELGATELISICDTLHLAADELIYAFETSGTDILSENLKYLMARGEQKIVAEVIGVHKTNISKWKAGKQRPEKKNLEKMIQYFGLPEDIDLNNNPLFLSLRPVTPQQRREWILERLNKISAHRLAELFPALESLFERDH